MTTTHTTPYRVSTRELGRQAGSSRRLRVVAPAPAELVVGLVVVPQQPDLELDVLLEAVTEGILARISALVPAAAECARCLASVALQVPVDARELFVYPGADRADEELPVVDVDHVDLEPVVRDAIGLALPLAPLCRPDCGGLCPRCGARLDDDPGHAHDDFDPRWEALTALLADGGAAEAAPDVPPAAPHVLRDIPDAAPDRPTRVPPAAPAAAQPAVVDPSPRSTEE
jgi:uncharacterized protein